MFFSTCSAGALPGPDFYFIFAPCGYDEPEILPSGSPSIGLTGADGEQPARPRCSQQEVFDVCSRTCPRQWKTQNHLWKSPISTNGRMRFFPIAHLHSR